MPRKTVINVPVLGSLALAVVVVVVFCSCSCASRRRRSVMLKGKVYGGIWGQNHFKTDNIHGLTRRP